SCPDSSYKLETLVTQLLAIAITESTICVFPRRCRVGRAAARHENFGASAIPFRSAQPSLRSGAFSAPEPSFWPVHAEPAALAWYTASIHSMDEGIPFPFRITKRFWQNSALARCVLNSRAM